MPRKDKYYGTYINLNTNMFNKLKEFGYKGHRNQFRIICKAKSRAEANRIAEKFGLYKNTFHPDFTSETGNETEIKMADKYGLIICINDIVDGEYVGIEKLL